MKGWSEWSPSLIISETELLNRVLLQKAWIAWTEGQTVYFNELPITLTTAYDLFIKAGINPHTYHERMGVKVLK